MAGNWRGNVGVIKPTYRSASLVEFIKLLPEGIGVIPLFIGVREHTEDEYRGALPVYNEKVAELAKIGVDLIHPEGAPPFMVRGYKAEQEIVRDWEAQYNIPIFTSGMTQVEALKALGIHRFVGVNYHTGPINDLFARYFTDAGLEILAMEGMDVPPSEWRHITSEDMYRHIKAAYLRHPEAQAVYLLGSGTWGVKDVLVVEEDLGVPVLHPVAARVWYVQKRLHVRQPVKGAGRLLEAMP